MPRKTLTIAVLATCAILMPLAALRPAARAAGQPASNAPLHAPAASAHPGKFVAYNFTWGKIPGNPDKAIAQMHMIYQWTQTYLARHNGLYPKSGSDFDMDVFNNPQAYGLNSAADAYRVLFNPDTRYAESALHQPKTVAFILFQPRYDGTALGGPKVPGTRDVLASTPMYVHTNWRHGIPTGQVGFDLVLWDDGTVTRVSPSQRLIVPLFALAGKPVTQAAIRDADRRHQAIGFTYAFPGQAGLPSNSMTIAEGRSAGLGVSF